MEGLLQSEKLLFLILFFVSHTRLQRQLEERDARLKEISNKIKKANKVDQMVTKMSDAITPANVRRRQINYLGTVVPSCKVPHAIEVTKARREIYHNGLFFFAKY